MKNYVIFTQSIIIVTLLAGLIISNSWYTNDVTPQEKTVSENSDAVQYDSVYYDLEEFVNNLSIPDDSDGSYDGPAFIKVSLSLELSDMAHVAIIEQKMPSIRDAFILQLRDLTHKDLNGKEGTVSLRQKLLEEINDITRPVTIKDVLYSEILVQ